MNLHETIMGKRLIEGTLPSLVKAIEKFARVLERYNDLKEELENKKNER